MTIGHEADLSSERRAVFLSPIMPAAGGNGLAMRMGMFLSALASDARVDLVVLPVAGGDRQPSALAEACAHSVHVIDLNGGVETPLRLSLQVEDPTARLASFAAYGKPSLAGFLTMSVRAQVAALLKEFRPTHIHVGRSYLAGLVDLFPAGAMTTLDLDEDDFRGCSSLSAEAAAAGDAFGTQWLMLEAEAFHRHVGHYIGRFDRTYVSSAIDHAALAGKHDCPALEVVGNGIDLPEYHPRKFDGRTILFVGNLTYAPNLNGLEWFAELVLPQIEAKLGARPRLVIVGAGESDRLNRLASIPGVEVRGFVPDISEVYSIATIAIAPVNSGAGLRIKTLEAAAHMVPLVATSAAVEGSGLNDPEHCWIADRPQEFADRCIEALGDRASINRTQRARNFVAANHTRTSHIERLRMSFASCIREF